MTGLSRGGQEPNAGAGARRRDARGCAHLELPHRPARPGRVGRGDRRPGPQPEDRRRRCAARVPPRADRAPAGRADAPDRHPAPAGGEHRSHSSHRLRRSRLPSRAQRRFERRPTCSRRPSDPRSSPAAAPCSPTPALSSSGSASGSARSSRRRRRPTGCSPGSRTRWGSRGGFASPFAAELLAPGRRRARRRRVGQPLDDEARRDDQPRRQGDPDRHRGQGDRAQPPRRHRRDRRRQDDRDEADRSPRATRARKPPASAPRSWQQQIASRRWRDEPYEDASTDEWIDPRTLSIALNRALPANRAVAVDSGHFLGYPSMFLDVPDARAWVFPNGFQAVGLGLGNAHRRRDRANRTGRPSPRSATAVRSWRSPSSRRPRG